MFWLPESPDFYFAKGRFTESKKVLLDIAKFNGLDPEEIEPKIRFEKAAKDAKKAAKLAGKTPTKDPKA